VLPLACPVIAASMLFQGKLYAGLQAALRMLHKGGEC